MSTQTIKAADNPGLANQLAQQMAKETAPAPEVAKIVPPSETSVTLPGGFVTSSGEVITEAEVRELNGRDEEAIAKSTSVGRVLSSILSRGTVKLGDIDVTEEILDQMYAGDRDALLLGIYRATFGNTAELTTFCSGCSDYKTLEIDVTEDIKVKRLKDPIESRKFEVKGKKHNYVLVLPTGKLQKELLLNGDKTVAELTTILLEGTVREIDGAAVFNKAQIQSIGLADRRILADGLAQHAFGPIMDDVKAACPDCGTEVVAQINIGTLFQF